MRIFDSIEIVGAGFDRGEHLVEPHLELYLLVEFAPLTFPGQHAFRFNLNHHLEHWSAGVGKNAWIASHAVIDQ